LRKGLAKVYEQHRGKLDQKLGAHMEKITDQYFLKARTEIGHRDDLSPKVKNKHFWEAGVDAAFQIFEDNKLVSRLEEVREIGLDKELEEIYPTIVEEITENARIKSLKTYEVYRQYLNAGFVHSWRRIKKYYAQLPR